MSTTTSTAVDRFLDAILAGAGVPAELLSEGVVLDATVPGWRFSAKGVDSVRHHYGRFFADPGSFEELERLPVEGGEVVTYLLTWEERGVPHAARHCHVLHLDADERIAVDHFFCGGRWDAALLARMEEENSAG